MLAVHLLPKIYNLIQRINNPIKKQANEQYRVSGEAEVVRI